MAEPVTIGGQTFVKTNEGWVDKKTKTQAPEGLFKLLNTLSAESTGDYKRLRVRVDRTKPPVTLANEEYIFDLNQGKWLNKKTKDPVNDALQKIINGVIAKIEAEKGAMASSIADSMGISGQAARSTVRTTTRAGKLPAPSIKINSPIVSMIEKLATIDGYLKQKLDNQKKIASQNLASAKETAIEATASDAFPTQEIKTEDATKSNAGNIAGALLIGGLIASQFEPVQEAFKTMIDGVKGVFNFVNDVAKSIADGLDFFTGSSATTPSNATQSSSPTTSTNSAKSASAPTAVAASPVTIPSETNIAEEPILATPTPQTRTPAQTAQRSEPTTAAKPTISTASPTVSSTSSSQTAQKSATPTPAQSNTRMAAPSSTAVDAKPAPSASPKFDITGGANMAAAFTGDAVPVSTAKNVVAVSHPDTGDGFGIAGANDQSGRPIAFTKEGAEAFSKMMAESGGAVKPSDITSSKRSITKNASLPNSATNSLHLSGIAMDIHGTSKSWIKANGNKYGWVENAYSGSHGGHFEFKGPGMAPSGGSDNMIVAAGQAVYDLGAGALKAISSIIGAGLGPQAKRSVTESLSQYAPNTAGEIAMASVKRSGDIAEAKTPDVDTSVSIKDPMDLNKNKPTEVVQNIPTSSDYAGVDFYLTRMGFPKIEYHVPVKQERMA